MNGEVSNDKDEVEIDDDVDENPAPDETVVLTEDLADIGDAAETTSEINVDELVAKVEAGDADVHQKEIHRKMEELEEQRRVEQELDSTFNFNLDDEL